MAEAKYRCWYEAICLRGQSRPAQAGTEKHHIIPRSCGGPDDASNIAVLTYREHFLAHWLLTKFLSGDQKRRMKYALIKMCHPPKWSDKIVAGWQFEVAKRAVAEANVDRRHTAGVKAKISASHVGKKHSAETKAKMSVAAKKRAPETMQTQRLAARNPSAEGKAARAAAMGRPETRAKLSAAARSRPPISQETRDKLAAAIYRRGPTSEETRQKLRVAKEGYTHSAETRAKLKEAWMRRRLASVTDHQLTL